MGDRLSIDELAERTGESAGRLSGWRDRGLIGNDTGDLYDGDVERVWLIRTLLGRGVGLDEVARTVRDHADVLAR